MRFGLEPKAKAAGPSAGGRVNAAAIPRSRTFGRLGQRVAKKLRESDLHFVIELGKRMGVKKALFEGGAQPNQGELGQALSPWQSAFAEDREALTRLLDRSLRGDADQAAPTLDSGRQTQRDTSRRFA